VGQAFGEGVEGDNNEPAHGEIEGA
jgi:hypothetical protein